MAFKLFGLVVALLLLMAAAAAISLFEAQRVSGRLISTIEGYIPTYAALARANVRSLEQALMVRRVLLNRFGPSEPAQRLHEAIVKAKQAAEEVGSARILLERKFARARSCAEILGLVRLDTRLEAVQSDFDQLTQKNEVMVRALGDGKAPDAEMANLELMINRVNIKLDAVRNEMRELLEAAGRQTDFEQRRVVLVSVVVLRSPPFWVSVSHQLWPSPLSGRSVVL